MPDFEVLKQNARNKTRRVLLDNDGCDTVYECSTADPKELLKQRTLYLSDSKVDTYFYCTWSSGLGVYTHNTKVGSIFNTKDIIFKNNKTQEFIDQGTDCLKIMTQYCNTNNIEIFWTMRMNDVHDNHGAEYSKTMYQSNQFKLDNPDCMIATYGDRPPYGAGTAADFEKEKVRQLVLDSFREVMENYNVDGILLDFFRHPVFFKEPAYGTPATQAQLGIMTELVRNVNMLADELGRKRNRPFLMAVRVPDSVPFCKTIGLDIEKWLKEGLVDLLVTSSYLQLNHWEYSVALGHRYNIPVYPSLDESRVRDENARKSRHTLKAFRGRVMNILNSGADGVFIFNNSGLNRDNLISCIHEPLNNPTLYADYDKDYFVSIRGVGAVAGSCFPHNKYINIPVLNPHHPIVIKADNKDYTFMEMGNDALGCQPKTYTLKLFFKESFPKEVNVFFNGECFSLDNTEGNTATFKIDEKLIKAGTNIIFMHNPSREDVTLLDALVQVRLR